jgi:hypothetical protein
MTPEVFAEWFRRQGYRVVQTKSSYWVEFGPRVYQAFPYHWVIKPEQVELNMLMYTQKALGLRYSTSLDFPEGCISYHAVYENSNYNLDKLGKWTRKNVQRGLKNCKVEPITFDYLAEYGYILQVDTLKRQGRKIELEKSTWNTLCISAKELPGFTAWGAFVNKQLAASVITFEIEDYGYMLYQQCNRRFLADHVNNALAFVVSQALIHDKGLKSILYGLHSLDAPSSVDEFKFRMGYIARPVRQRIVFHPIVAPIFNRLTHTVIKGFVKLQPGNPFLAKAEGMIRFYLEGKKPLDKQNIPSVLDRSVVDSLINK